MIEDEDEAGLRTQQQNQEQSEADRKAEQCSICQLIPIRAGPYG